MGVIALAAIIGFAITACDDGGGGGGSFFTVTYDGNDNTGGAAPTDPTSYKKNATVTVLDKGTLTKTGNSFDGWSTSKNGMGGKDYAAGATFVITANTTLYAKWTTGSSGSGPFTVTYDGNGNTGGTVPVDNNSPYPKDAEVTVLGNTGNLAKSGNAFGGWNTAADGSGTAHAAGAKFNITANTTLYAKWTPTGGGAITLPATFTFGADNAALSASGWIKDQTSGDNKTDVDMGNGFTLTGTKRGSRWLPTQAKSPHTGCIQPNGSGDWGLISGITGNYKVTIIYTGTGGSGSGRTISIKIGGGAVVTGPETPAATDLLEVTATGSGDAVLTASGGVRVYQVKIENP